MAGAKKNMGSKAAATQAAQAIIASGAKSPVAKKRKQTKTKKGMGY